MMAGGNGRSGPALVEIDNLASIRLNGNTFHGLDARVSQATRPQPLDNQASRSIRNAYRRTFDVVRRQLVQAMAEAAEWGSGHHILANGEELEVAIHGGQVCVRTLGCDGSTKTVSYQDGGDTVRINTLKSDGSRESLCQSGNTVGLSRTRQGHTSSDRYTLDRQGCPVHEEIGCGCDDYARTVVYLDGSCDARKLSHHDEAGRPVYETIHRGAGGPLV